MGSRETMEDWLHSANNCRQMLSAMERRMDKAMTLLESGEADKAREMLTAVREGMPRAIAMIDFGSLPPEADAED